MLSRAAGSNLFPRAAPRTAHRWCFGPAGWLTACLALPAACARREPPLPPPPAVPPIPTTHVVAPLVERPQFADTPDGAARKFLYAWLTGDDALMAEVVVPDPRVPQLFAAGWVAPARQQQALQRILTEPVREFQPGDLFPVGPPGGPTQMRPVPATGLGPARRLLMLADRGLYVVREGERWRVDASGILDSFQSSYRFSPPPEPPPAAPSTPPTAAAAGPTAAPPATRPHAPF